MSMVGIKEMTDSELIISVAHAIKENNDYVGEPYVMNVTERTENSAKLEAFTLPYIPFFKVFVYEWKGQKISCKTLDEPSVKIS